MPGGATSLLVVQLVLAQAVSYEAAARTEVRALAGAASLREIEVNPILRLAVDDRELSLALAYHPAFVLQDQPVDSRIVHRAAGASTWRIDRDWRLDVLATGSYGRENLLLSAGLPPGMSSPLAPAAPLILPLPVLASVPHAGASAILGLTARIDPRTAANLAIGWSVDGSTDRAAQAYLPMHRSATATASLDAGFPRDVLRTRASVTLDGFSNGRRDGIGTLTQEWRTDLGQQGQGWIAAGPSVVWREETGRRSGSATASAGVRYALRDPALQATAGGSVSPVADRTTGAIYDRGDGNLALDWRLSGGWTVHADGFFGQVLNGAQAGEQIVASELRVDRTDGRRWHGAAGARSRWQLGDPRRGGFNVWTFYVELTAVDRGRL